MNVRTLGEFRKLTAGLPDDTPLLRGDGDHMYSSSGVQVETTALKEGNIWTEDVYPSTIIGELTDYGARTSVVAFP